MRRLLPRAGWHPIDAEDAAELGVPVRQAWEVFSVAWGAYGVALAIRPRRAR